MMKFDLSTIDRHARDALLDMVVTKPKRAVLTGDLVARLGRNGLEFDFKSGVTDDDDLGAWLVDQAQAGQEPYASWAKYLGGYTPPWMGWEWRCPLGTMNFRLRALIPIIKVLRRIGAGMSYPP
jgi:hypothetical protein